MDLPVTLTVAGRRYGGWQSVRVTRGIDAMCGGFELGVTDRWAEQLEEWPILEGDACTVELGGEPVITGHVDTREVAFDAQSHTARVVGRDAAADLVDSSAAPGELRNVSVVAACRTIADPFGVSVAVAPDASTYVSAAQRLVTVDPGETAGEVIDRICRAAGVLPISDGLGGLQLVRGSTERLDVELVEGKNILAGRASFSLVERFASYRVLGSASGTSHLNGSAASAVSGTATDPLVRATRTKVVRGEQALTSAGARTRAEWEAVTRAARGDSVTVTVRGWSTGGPGAPRPWPVNTVVRVRSPRLRVDGDMLLVRVTHSLDTRGGERTELELVRPDAYRPAPVVGTPAGNMGGAWRELARGGL